MRVAGRVNQAADRIVTPRLARQCAIVLLALMLPLFTAAFGSWRSCTASVCKPIASDLAPHLAAARIVLAGDPHHLYDLSYQFAIEQRVLSGHYWPDPFISPPFVAYLYVPLAHLPYLLSAALWTLLTVTLLALSLRLLWPLLPSLQRFGFGSVILIAFSAEFVFDLVGSGQDSAISLLIFAAGLRLLLARRDASAGAVLAFGLMKPQLAIAFPFVFLLQRQWRALGAWLAVAGALVAGSVAIVGLSGAESYVRLVLSSAYQYGAGAPLSFKELSIIALVHGLLPSQTSWLVLPVAAAILIPLAIGFVRLARRGVYDETDVCLLYALTVTFTVLLSPHIFAYDGVLLLLPALVLADRGTQHSQIRLALVLTYMLAWAAVFRYVVFGTLSWPISMIVAPWTVVGVLLIYRCIAAELAERIDVTRSDSDLRLTMTPGSFDFD